MDREPVPQLTATEPNAQRAIQQTLKLNVDQISVYNIIMQSIIDTIAHGQSAQNVYYIDGPGGTGKTFLYNVILDVIEHVLKKTYLAVAWTGIAATLLRKGRTVHGTFRLPLQLTETSTAGYHFDTPKALTIKNAVAIIWDEAPMSSKKAINAVDRYLKELMQTDRPMGGKIVIFGGDFRQLLPVIHT